ncbi:hypothetical protein IKG13_02720 [Candidatus Saccharibacteria bacterium]|nr:hypothetical protein [Candidatus Saccharibacteria bacterium]MBR3378062.1 hypothetical protein [Candidatus Saccharibacteria bacterium]
MSYLQTIPDYVKQYFEILEPDFPEWLKEYIETPAMLKQQYISMTCGVYYTKLFNCKAWYSSLDHSIGVALIVWHFTHDKKQTLAGLFHDIATPAFKHCIDFLNGDYETQESTEDLTSEIIANSKEIQKLLKRDGLTTADVDNYHLYPIADNDTPQLSADRLEYSFSNGAITYGQFDLSIVKELYNDLEVEKDEQGNDEIAFKTKKYARKFVLLTSKLSILYRNHEDRYSMQLIADIIKNLHNEGKIALKDLYELKESDFIDIIEKSKYANSWKTWCNATKVKISKTKPKDCYYVHHPGKVRYITPLVKGERINKICKIAQNAVDKNLVYDQDYYVFIPEIKDIY